MRVLAFAFLCLAKTSSCSRVRASKEVADVGLAMQDPLAAFATMLMASDEPASFSVPTGVGRIRAPKATSSRDTSVVASAAGRPTLHVGVVGYGLVGKELVDQIALDAKKGALASELGVALSVSGVATSKSMALLDSYDGQPLDMAKLDTVPSDFEKLGAHLVEKAKATGGRAMIVDNTASDAPAEHYEKWLKAGIDVVTPNKRAGSGPYDRYNKIMEASKAAGSSFLYETTVGAGLPVIGSIQNLRRAGDEIEKVEGIFSGTLSYIFNTWKPGMKYSDVVEEAKEKGFTEPDPRDDLGGTDVQRKVTILARELGLNLELDDVPVESLVPEKLRDWSPPEGKNLADAFIEETRNYDDEMDKLIKEAEDANQVLRFVGSIDLKAGKASVKLGRFAKDHPFAGTQFADNIVAVDSKWYSPRPLVIQGPGAGAAVTAAGVFGNVIDIMKTMRKPM